MIKMYNLSMYYLMDKKTPLRFFFFWLVRGIHLDEDLNIHVVYFISFPPI